MRTAPHMTYSAYQMKQEYVDASVNNCDYYLRYPTDYGCIDAPSVIPSGSHHSYKTHALPSGVLRGDK